MLSCPSIASSNTSRAAAVCLGNPYCIYCRSSTLTGHIVSGRTQAGHLGSPRLSQNWFGWANFRPRLLPPRDSLGYRASCVTTATSNYLYTDTWLCWALLLKLFSVLFRHISLVLPRRSAARRGAADIGSRGSWLQSRARAMTCGGALVGSAESQLQL